VGKIATSKLANGNIGLEITYGGADAPFGGIDTSASPRYIDPRCFVDADNFLIIDNEMCVCSWQPSTFPENPGVTYPIDYPNTQPSQLIGVGKLPCEAITKNWALFVSSEADSNNYFYYRLIIWATDTSDTEVYNFILPGQTITAPPVQAQATITVGYAPGFTAIQNVPAYAINPGPVLPATYDGKFYEISPYSSAVNGAPTGGGPNYQTSLPIATYGLYGNTPASGPVQVPTPASIAALLATDLNGGGGLLPFTAAVASGNPNQVILTAYTQSGYPSVDGTAGNSMSLAPFTAMEQFGYFPNTTGLSFVEKLPPPFGVNYSPFTTNSFIFTLEPFSGGTDGGQILYSALPIGQLTYETVGDNLFIAGYPAGYMLWFNNTTKQFNILTNYQGAKVLRKFAGHLVSVGLINSASQIETDPYLWLNWSAEGEYAVWNALDSQGLVTGAGGEQLADISDMLTGLIISNSTAFILHAEGLSYATALQGNATEPFDVNHVSNVNDGQGCPSSQLNTQYDQMGFYVGQSNVFTLIQGPQAIGTKIAAELFPSLIAESQRSVPFQDVFYQSVNTIPLTVLLNNNVRVFFCVNVAGVLYFYDAGTDVWMKMDATPYFPTPSSFGNHHILKAVSLPVNSTTGFDGSYQYKGTYLYEQFAPRLLPPSGNMLDAPVMFVLLPELSSTTDAYVTFPAEEISNGRDIIIDALFLTCSGIPGTQVLITVGGWQSYEGSAPTFVPDLINVGVTLDANATPDSDQEYQVFPADGAAITCKAPQVQLMVPAQTPPTYTPPVAYPVDSKPQFKFSKLVMFGSFDPNQRPV
jgi:hypothetical protein